MNRLSTAVLISSSFFLFTVQAQTPPTPPSPPAPPPPAGFVNGQAIVLDSVRDALLMRFEKLDGNGDGVLSGEEIPTSQIAGRAKEKRAKAKHRHGGKATKRERRAGRGKAPDSRDLQSSLMPSNIEGMDQNGDGKVSREEMTAIVDQLATLDLDGNGTLDSNETAFLRGLMRRMGERMVKSREAQSPN